MKRVNGANVPVVNYNFMAQNADVACLVVLDAIQIAESIAQDAVKAAARGNYMLVLGEEGARLTQDERKGYRNILKPYVASGAIKVVSEPFNKGCSTGFARAHLENALTKVKTQTTTIVCDNHGTVYGAILASHAQGPGGKAFVNRVDADSPALDLIKQSLMTKVRFTGVCQYGIATARAAQKLANVETINTV